MTSREFSFCRRTRCETKCLQKLLKNIKTTRIRKDRRLTKVILKKTHNQDLLLYKICKSNGAYKIS